MKKIFTWHIHGSYLYYLSQGNYEIYIPVKEDRSQEGYHGRGHTFPFGKNVIEIPVSDISNTKFDCILYQSNKNYLIDQYEVLSQAQQQLPKVYLEHNTPDGHAVDTKHVISDNNVKLVHVTHYNALMWDNNNHENIQVIDHGITTPSMKYSGELAKGIVVINNLPIRGRIAGYDIFQEVARHVPIDLVGMGTEKIGLGEVLHPKLPEFLSHYRFYLHPARHTSLGLSLLEAMMIGMPVVGLATTELPTVIQNGISGFTDTNLDILIEKMKVLIGNQQLAADMGKQACKTAMERFNIHRFTTEWEQLFDKHIQNN